MDVLLAIESVLFDEKKTSTYKFALVTAIIDYVIENPNEFPENGFHYIPIIYLAKRWLYYYYPLMVYGERGVRQGSTQVSLHRFVREFVEKQKDKSINYFEPEAILKIKERIEDNEILDKELISLLIKIRRVIISQPLQFIKIASNSFIQEELVEGIKFKDETFSLFGLYNSLLKYNEKENYQSIRSKSTNWEGERKAQTWLELEAEETLFIQMGHYTYKELAESRFFIKDAIIKRWLEYSVEKYLQADAKAIYALFYGLKLHEKRLERESGKIQKMRKIALTVFKPMKCIYCGKEIEKFELDHLIPWSKFPVDRFWNLFPACENCNRKKSDKIISLERNIQSKIAEYLKAWLEYFMENEEELAVLGGKETHNLNLENIESSIHLLLEQIKEINQNLI